MLKYLESTSKKKEHFKRAIYAPLNYVFIRVCFLELHSHQKIKILYATGTKD